jgi:hypothetical protein
VTEILRRHQHEPDLFRAQDDREFLLIPGQGDAFDTDLKMHCVGVEKTEAADGLYVGGKRHSLLFDQVQLILSDLLWPSAFAKHFANVARKGGGQSGSRRGPHDRRGRVMPAEERALTSGVLVKEGRSGD